MLSRIAVAIGLLTSALAAQAPAEPSFDVVSIRAVPANAPPTVREFDFTPVRPGGQYIDSRTGLRSMITFAYDIPNWFQLVGLPKWAVEASYSIAAKPAEGFPALPASENREQVRLMMRAMLAERFNLQIHTEDRHETIYRLEVVKGGPRIKEVDAPVPPATEGRVSIGLSDRGGRMVGQKSTAQGMPTPWPSF
jgi:uncharacterized protein (TIGR03435 family)